MQIIRFDQTVDSFSFITFAIQYKSYILTHTNTKLRSKGTITYSQGEPQQRKPITADPNNWTFYKWSLLKEKQSLNVLQTSWIKANIQFFPTDDRQNKDNSHLVIIGISALLAADTICFLSSSLSVIQLRVVTRLCLPLVVRFHLFYKRLAIERHESTPL